MHGTPQTRVRHRVSWFELRQRVQEPDPRARLPVCTADCRCGQPGQPLPCRCLQAPGWCCGACGRLCAPAPAVGRSGVSSWASDAAVTLSKPLGPWALLSISKEPPSQIVSSYRFVKHIDISDARPGRGQHHCCCQRARKTPNKMPCHLSSSKLKSCNNCHAESSNFYPFSIKKTKQNKQ